MLFKKSEKEKTVLVTINIPINTWNKLQEKENYDIKEVKTDFVEFLKSRVGGE